MAPQTAAPNGKSSIAKFQPGFDPEEIALKYTDGKPVTSKFDGDQVMFTLSDGRKWFTETRIAQKIGQMRIQPGEVFEVCRVETRRGNQKITDVEITAVVETKAGEVETKVAGPALPEAKPAGHQGAAQNKNTQSNGSTPQQLPPNAVPFAVNVPMNGNGETSAAQLARCYRDAVDIAVLTVEYGKKVGLAIAPAFCDVRALAATLAISEQQGRRP